MRGGSETAARQTETAETTCSGVYQFGGEAKLWLVITLE